MNCPLMVVGIWSYSQASQLINSNYKARKFIVKSTVYMCFGGVLMAPQCQNDTVVVKMYGISRNANLAA
jgi:hypothetical protein